MYHRFHWCDIFIKVPLIVMIKNNVEKWQKKTMSQMRHEEGVGGIFLTDGSRINRPTGSRKEKLYNKSLINRKYTLKSGCWGCYKLQI